MENKLQVGQVLYSSSLKEYWITKIGKMYFYANNEDRKYLIENLRYTDRNYSQSNMQLYLTKQEILDDQELRKLNNEMYKMFCNYGNCELSLQQLRKIKTIIDERPDKT